MEPTTILLAVSSVTLLAGITLRYMKSRQKVKKETRAMKEARLRAVKRANERALTGDIVRNHYDPLEFNTSNITVKHHGKRNSIPLSTEQTEAINSIFGGLPLPAKHRPFMHSGPGALESAGVPLSESVLDEHNKDFSSQIDVEFLEPDYNWPERYDREVPRAPREELKGLDIELDLPKSYARG